MIEKSEIMHLDWKDSFPKIEVTYTDSDKKSVVFIF